MQGLDFRWAGALAPVAALFALAPSGATAATIDVTSPADSGAGSLRAAVAAAANGDELVIAAGVNPALTSGELAVAGKQITVRGQGAAATQIDAGTTSRIFDVAAGAGLTIEDLTLANGKAPNGPGGGVPDASGGPGGAIRNLGSLTVADSVLRDSRAGNAGPSSDGGLANGGDGGAIYNVGTATISGSTLSANRGGSANSAGVGSAAQRIGGEGGAIFNGGTLTISDSDLSDNMSGPTAGTAGTLAPGTGGAIYNTATMTISGSEITGSRIAGIEFAGGGGGDGGAIRNTATATATIDSTLLDDNHAGTRGCTHLAGRGGAIRNDGSLTISGSTLTLNRAGATPPASCGSTEGGSAGAILNAGGAELEIADSFVSQNRATDGVWRQFRPAPHGGNGGAIVNEVGAELTVERSTLAGNQSGYGARSEWREDLGGDGGNGGAIFNAGTLTVDDSTLSGNHTGNAGDATGGTGGHGGDGGDGGAIMSTGTLSLLSSTVTENTVGVGGGATRDGEGSGLKSTNGAAGSDTVKASIIAGNSGASQCAPGLSSLGYNVVGVASQCPTDGPGDVAAAPAGIGPLADNGGPVPTHALLASSPALDIQAAADPECTGTDARGILRPEGPGCDAGAYELAADRALTVTIAGSGAGSVTGPGGLACPSACAVSLPAYSDAKLTATPAAGSSFAGFSGACTGLTCELTMGSPASVTATFTPIPGGGGPPGGGPSDEAPGELDADLRLRGSGERIGAKLRVDAGARPLQNVRLVVPSDLRVADAKSLRRLASATADGAKLAGEDIARTGRRIKVAAGGAEQLTLKLKRGALRAARELAVERALKFKLRVVDSSGAEERLTLKTRLKS